MSAASWHAAPLDSCRMRHHWTVVGTTETLLVAAETQEQLDQVASCHLPKRQFGHPGEQECIRRRVYDAEKHSCESYLLYSVVWEEKGAGRIRVEGACTLKLNKSGARQLHK